MTKVPVKIKTLRQAGIEVLSRGPTVSSIRLPKHTILEAPCSVKWTEYEHSISLGAFSYQVSGYCFGARIGRYCSFGENVQIGRQNHPMAWASTSPAFYLGGGLFDLADTFDQAEAFQNCQFDFDGPPTQAKLTHIGHDVWIGHGAYIGAGVTIGTGAVIAAHSVVSKDIPAYAVVAGNPAIIKKMRLPSNLISPFLNARWWRFAPWQLQHLDPSQPKEFIQGVYAMADTQAYTPKSFDLREASVNDT